MRKIGTALALAGLIGCSSSGNSDSSSGSSSGSTSAASSTGSGSTSSGTTASSTTASSSASSSSGSSSSASSSSASSSSASSSAASSSAASSSSGSSGSSASSSSGSSSATSSSGSSGSSGSGTSSGSSSGSSGRSSSSSSGGTTASGPTIAVQQGNAQTGRIEELLSAVTVQFTDAAGGPIASQTINLVASEGASPATAVLTTNSQGVATFIPRLGRAPGNYTFTLSSGAASASVTATANAAGTGELFTLVNVDHTGGTPLTTGGPGITSKLNSPRGLAAAADGTLYISTNTYLFKLSPKGALTVLVGTGSGQNTGDTLQGTVASITPYGLALDEANHRLFIACDDRIRVLDLQTGIIDLYAGGTTAATSPGYGDDGPPLSARLISAEMVSLDPSGNLYVGDVSIGRIRKINADGTRITSWVARESIDVCSREAEFYGCGSTACGNIVWDAAGNAFFGATGCGTRLGSTVSAVLRRDPNGVLHHVAGKYQGAATPGISASGLLLESAPFVTMDAAGNLFLADATGDRIWKVEGGSSKVSLIAGDGTPAPTGAGGEYTAAATAKINNPAQLLLGLRNDLTFVEPGIHSVRSVAAAGSTTAAPAVLSLVAGDAQSVLIDQLAASPLSVKLVDAAGANLSGFDVQWAATEPSASVSTPSAPTNFQGRSAMTLRVGQAATTHHFTARFEDIHGAQVSGSPVAFTATATEPASGTLFTIANIDRASSPARTAGPATLAHFATPRGVVTSTDGSFYFVSNTQVFKVAASGVLTVVAGTGAGGNTGDNSDAKEATLNNLRALALDEANNLLYVAQYERVRVVDLSTETIYPFAGNVGVTASAPGYGDNGPATLAQFANIVDISVGPDGSLYIGDAGLSRVRKVDAGGVVTAYLNRAASNACTTSLEWYSCANNSCGQVHFDGSGNRYVTGYFCGTLLSQPSQSIVKIDSSGRMSLIAGIASGVTTDDVPATTARFATTPYIARASDGTLYVSETGSHRVRKIDPTTQRITTLVGDGTAGFSGDGAAAAPASRLSSPSQIALLPGNHLLISDENNNAIRVIW